MASPDSETNSNDVAYTPPMMTDDEKRQAYRRLFRPTKIVETKTAQKAKEELQETEGKRTEALKELRKLCLEENQSDEGKKICDAFLNKDDTFLLRFLRCKKFDVKRAYNQMTAYLLFREKHKDVTSKLHLSSLRFAISKGFPVILPNRDKEGRVWLLFDVGSWDHTEIPFPELMASLLYVIETLIENEETQVNGFVLLETYERYHIDQALAMKPADVKTMIDLLQGSFPGRFKVFNIIRQPWYFSTFWTLAKPFLSSKMTSRIMVHGSDLSKLYEQMEPEWLPTEFGGTSETFNTNIMLEELQLVAVEKGETINSENVTGETILEGLPNSVDDLNSAANNIESTDM
ncbi:retinaldehyde-binding protein 1-like [Gigantopelta aegis]|uniref:retinaldehyde-binding protein 1-like n=1 Tax=Gigantopelta aegis TaxID=1735272 RepID=UPI001B88CFE7|nr:retinaldehyde-binding protein 1-like [Gigantopelta aegis]XP_041355882.1 retinaldehyde-binding protein 1-like [Gigantopelta aegis]XP_041355883.1 retinaldehyde-binding protein 1-like [Gigantopelta aegis]